MNKELAKKLEPLVTNHKAYEALLAYLTFRIEARRDLLEISTDPEIDRGAIAELRQMLKLREITINTLEVKDG